MSTQKVVVASLAASSGTRIKSSDNWELREFDFLKAYFDEGYRVAHMSIIPDSGYQFQLAFVLEKSA